MYHRQRHSINIAIIVQIRILCTEITVCVNEDGMRVVPFVCLLLLSVLSIISFECAFGFWQCHFCCYYCTVRLESCYKLEHMGVIFNLVPMPLPSFSSLACSLQATSHAENQASWEGPRKVIVKIQKQDIVLTAHPLPLEPSNPRPPCCW